MKPSSITTSLLALLLAATACFVACGASTNGDPASGGGSGNAGKASTNGGAGAGASSGGSSSHGGSANDLTCPTAECGPALGIANTTCPDGTLGGPTGRCLRLETGGCGWEVLSCPPAGEGGAGGAAGAAAAGGPPEGGAGGAGGAPSTDRCGGCMPTAQARQICIYQAGGPGPGRFVCATQNPCGAAGACSCIVAQGTCNFMLEGGSPGYCVCDNGLE